MNATVKDVMTTHVVAVRLNATYKEMAARLREFRVSAFPVLDDDNKVIGVVSEADLLTKEALEYSVPGLMRGILHGRERAKAAAVTAAEQPLRPGKGSRSRSRQGRRPRATGCAPLNADGPQT
jgi:CBS-domain-containing membrane protein